MAGIKKRFFKKQLAQTVCLVILLIRVNITGGQNIPADSSITRRLETIRQMLAEGKTNANRWWYGWLIGYSAATVVQTTVLITSDDLGTRQDMALGALTTLLGAAGQVVSPMVPGYASDKLQQMTENSFEEKKIKLAESERLLQESAFREKSGRSWKTHAICGIVNMGSGLVTWIGFDRNIWAGIGNFALNTAITEVQIFTQPARAMKDYRKYLEKYNGATQQSLNRPDLNWSVFVYPGKVGIRVIF